MSGYSLYDNHEWIGHMLTTVRTDKPFFLVGHSLGSLLIQTFLINNPTVPIAGIIHSAPMFGFSKNKGVGMYKRFISYILGWVADEVPTTS